MALPMKKAVVVSMEKALERRSEVRDLLRKTRLEQLRVAIQEGKYTFDPAIIADGVIADIKRQG
jgi:anti-sigma28 factor (negative regulator of flagellin synthesis)